MGFGFFSCLHHTFTRKRYLNILYSFLTHLIIFSVILDGSFYSRKFNGSFSNTYTRQTISHFVYVIDLLRLLHSYWTNRCLLEKCKTNNLLDSTNTFSCYYFNIINWNNASFVDSCHRNISCKVS